MRISDWSSDVCSSDLDLRTLSKLRAKFYGQREEDALNDLMEETQGQLERFTRHVMTSGGDARLFKQALDGSSKSLENDPGTEAQRAPLTKMAAATNASNDKHTPIEEPLVPYGNEHTAIRTEPTKARQK